MRITSQGKAKLDAVLEKHAGKDLPALFFAAATPDGVLYKGCRGDKVYGKPEEGPVSWERSSELIAGLGGGGGRMTAANVQHSSSSP
jgi:hypothetical protein